MVENKARQGYFGGIFTGNKNVEPEIEIVQTGVPGIEWRVTSDLVLDTIALHSHSENIRELASRCASPLTFREIQNHLSENPESWVLFDTVPGTFTGNHWRVANIDPGNGGVTLKFCGNFGNYDIKGIEPFTMSIDTPFFTGVSVQKYTQEWEEVIYWVEGAIIDPRQVKVSNFIPHLQK